MTQLIQPIKFGLGHKTNPSWFKPESVETLLKKRYKTRVGGSVTANRPTQFIKTIRDQGQSESCVGQGFAAGAELDQRGKGNDVPDLSARFAYYLAKLGENPKVDNGSSPFNAADGVGKFGFVAESQWQFTTNNILAVPTLDVFESGLDFKLTGVYTTQGDQSDTIKSCLDNGIPVGYAQNVDSNGFDSYQSGDILGPFSGTVRGSHFTVLVDHAVINGVDCAVGLNSWSVQWGSGWLTFSGGFYYISWERLADATNCFDFTVFDFQKG